MASHGPEKTKGDEHPEKGHGAEKKPGGEHAEKKAGEASAETRAKVAEAMHAHKNAADINTDEELHPRLVHARDEYEYLQELQRAHELESNALPLKRQYLYTAPRGVKNAALGTGALGGGLILTSAAPSIWAAMKAVELNFGAEAAAYTLPKYLSAGLPLAAGVGGAVAGWKLGGLAGKWIAKHSPLTEKQGLIAGRVIGASTLTPAAYIGTDWVLHNGIGRLMSLTTNNAAGVSTFSTLGAIPGALAGYYLGGKAGEWAGKHLFHHPGAGKWIGRAVGGIGGGWLTGAAGATVLSVWPGATLAAAGGVALWGLGRLEGYFYGRPRTGVPGTMLRGLAAPITLPMRAISKTAHFLIGRPLEGIQNAIEERRSHGFMQKITSTPVNIALSPFRAVRNTFEGLGNSLGIVKRDDRFPGKDSTMYKTANTIGDTGKSIVSSPVRLAKWLWEDRGGGHGHGGGHGGH